MTDANLLVKIPGQIIAAGSRTCSARPRKQGDAASGGGRSRHRPRALYLRAHAAQEGALDTFFSGRSSLLNRSVIGDCDQQQGPHPGRIDFYDGENSRRRRVRSQTRLPKCSTRQIKSRGNAVQEKSCCRWSGDRCIQQIRFVR